MSSACDTGRTIVANTDCHPGRKDDLLSRRRVRYWTIITEWNSCQGVILRYEKDDDFSKTNHDHPDQNQFVLNGRGNLCKSWITTSELCN